MSVDDRRKYARIPTQIIGHLRKSISEDVTVTDISHSGAFIETNMSFRVSDIIEFDLHVRGQKVSVSAVVRWRRHDVSPHGIGVEFLKVTAKNKERLTRIVERQLKDKTTVMTADEGAALRSW